MREDFAGNALLLFGSGIVASFRSVLNERFLGICGFAMNQPHEADELVPRLPVRLAVRFQNRIDEGHRRFQLRSLSHRCLSFYRNRTEHRLTHHASMNPQLLGDPSNRSTAMLILTSNLLE